MPLPGCPKLWCRSTGESTCWVNNAGVALMGDFLQTSSADFDWLFAINFTAAVHATRAFLPHLLRQPASQIVNLSSLFGLVAPPGQSAYAAAKFALRGFSEALGHELEATSVGVTVVHPGGVATNIARNAKVSADIEPEDARKALSRFSRSLVTMPEAAAARIVEGILRRESTDPDRPGRAGVGHRATPCPGRLLCPAAKAHVAATRLLY